MKFIPSAINRKIAEQAIKARKNSPQILFGVGVASMVGSTVLACHATLKLNEVFDEIEENKAKSQLAKEKVDAGEVENVTYTDEEMRRDRVIIYTRGVVKVVKLYAPAIIVGGIGVVCLTRSHQILKERNAALAAAYVAIDTAFRSYRGRVVDRYGEDVDREMRYGAEEVDIIDEETGKITTSVRVEPGEPSGYARWFDETVPAWSPPPQWNYNFVWLRHQQNWANDILMARGHIFLNEVYGQIGLTHTTAGAVVGWVYDRDNKTGDNFVDFGCWDQRENPIDFVNGRDGAILLDFNVDGVIYDLIDKREDNRAIPVEIETNQYER